MVKTDDANLTSVSDCLSSFEIPYTVEKIFYLVFTTKQIYFVYMIWYVEMYTKHASLEI